MLYHKLLLGLLPVFFLTRSYAETFTVTSTLNSGAGSLREAITKAADNGSGETDLIQFDLPGTRRIVITTGLPGLSSNLLIDGTTQPGTPFMASNAKVILSIELPPDEENVYGLRIVNCTNVTILGLYIRTVLSSPPHQKPWRGISVTNSKKINIGEAGKGNVIYRFESPLDIPKTTPGTGCEDLSVKGNFFGIDADGVTTSDIPEGNVTLSDVLQQVDIGGIISEGNVFATGLTIGQVNIDAGAPPAFIRIRNNKIGVDVTGQHTIPVLSGLSVITTSGYGNNAVGIEGNVIANFLDDAVKIARHTQKVIILRNCIGTDRTKTPNLTVAGIGINITNQSGNVEIGSDNPADANYIANCKPLQFFNTPKVKISRNSIFCIPDGSLSPAYGNVSNLPVVSITNMSFTAISGTATPNSIVELFFADHCNSCAPENYFRSVTADNAGNWTSTGTISNDVIVSATLNGSTSEFRKTTDATDNTTPFITCKEFIPPTGYPDYPVDKKNTCLGQSTGSIHVITDVLVKSIRWEDASGAFRGDANSVSGLPAGEYSVFFRDVNNVRTLYDTYTIEEIPAVQIANGSGNVTHDECNTKTGSITGVAVSSGLPPYTYKWLNAAGVSVSTSADLTGVGEGTYALQVTDAAGCQPVSSQPYMLTNADNPIPAPKLENAVLCSPGDVLLQVMSPVAGALYRVYPEKTTGFYIAENTAGKLKVPVAKSGSVFVTMISGTCESPRTEVRVDVGLTDAIANTITPNGDGFNDLWVIKGIENYPKCNVRIFTRGGQKVFESNGYGVPFNGTFGGQNLPVGTYYYVIRLNNTCGLVSGHLNILR